MIPTVTLKISNVNNSDYPTINLRKFFNMVFVDHKGKKFHIYTATVFGGAERVNLKKQEEHKNPPKPKAKRASRCSLQFEYVIQDNHGHNAQNHVVSAKCEDLTKEFLSTQGEMPNRSEIEHVWGDVTTLGEQVDLKNALRTLYSDQYKDEDDANLELPDMAKGGPFLKIMGNNEEASHQFIACPGQFSIGKTENRYTLTASEVVGVEAINWVMTTIELDCDILKPRNISDRKVDFVVQFAQNGTFYTPDFTWYFAPPPNYVVEDMTLVDIGKGKNLPNKVMPVADRTTVRFAEWLKEGILERKKSRVLMSEFITADPYILNGNPVKVNLSFNNPGKHGNSQFLVGLIVSHLLGFCSDIDRLSEYTTACANASLCQTDCIISAVWGHCICDSICNLLSIFFPVAFIFAFFAFCFRAQDCIPVDERTRIGKLAILLRWVGWVATAFLVMYIHVGWLVAPAVMSAIIRTCVTNQLIVAVSLIVSLIGTGFYTMYCWLVKKRNLIDFF